ncbi:MAG: hypothetical protein M5R36_12820 [Deltaproteobacteria bacterium]|nr:hypothetical protein [Deltaproteobacteria bacterium]
MEPGIAQACVLGDRRPHLAAVIVPDAEYLAKWFDEHGKTPPVPESLADDPDVTALVQKALDRVNEKLARFETVNKFVLAPAGFTQENGLLTPTHKVVRKQVQRLYSHEIDQLY